jgi:GNAT superfamily N-acetyltransferase
MVERTAADGSLVDFALRRAPDLPRWIDTRGMLLSGRAEVFASAGARGGAEGAIVVVRDSALASIAGRPSGDAIASVIGSLSGDVNVLAQMEDADYVARALNRWRRRTAIIHVLPCPMPWEQDADPQARVFTRQNAPRFSHVPETLRRELLDALKGRTVSRFVPGELPASGRFVGGITVPIAAVWADGRPVSFCYPVWQTEAHWDVSIDTLAPYRRRGFGARAARTLIRHMRGIGRAPVWGALESNSGSRALAARLGFLEAAGIAVFTAR